MGLCSHLYLCQSKLKCSQIGRVKDILEGRFFLDLDANLHINCAEKFVSACHIAIPLDSRLGKYELDYSLWKVFLKSLQS